MSLCVCGLLSQIMSCHVINYLGAWLQIRLCTTSYPWYKSGMWRMPTPHHYHLNYQSTMDSLSLCTLEGLVHVRLRVAHHEMTIMMWRTQILALLLGHFFII